MAATSCSWYYHSLAQDTCTSIAAFVGMQVEDLRNANPVDHPCTSGNPNLQWCINTPAKDFCGEDNTQVPVHLGDTCESLASAAGWSLDQFHVHNPNVPCVDGGALVAQGVSSVCIPTAVDQSNCDGFVLNNRDYDYCYVGDKEQTLLEATTCDQIASQFSSEFYIIGSEQHCCDTRLAAGTKVCAPGPHECAQIHTTGAGETCEAVGELYDVQEDQLQYDNPNLDCSSVLPADSSICIAHPEPAEPTPAPAPLVVARADAKCKRTYTALAGDNCTLIGYWHGLTAEAVKAANPTVNCDDIWAWTPICITTDGATDPKPACTKQYTAKQGDTCDSVARQQKGNAIDVWAMNRFVGCNDIWAGTPLCLVGESAPTCAFTYSSQGGDNCSNIEYKFRLDEGDVKAANPNLNCNDIWPWTPVCIPPTDCECETWWTTYSKTTCNDVGNRYKVGGDAIRAWNSFVNCDDIWSGTTLCVSH